MTENIEQQGEIAIYRTEDGGTALDVKLAEHTVWLSQRQIARLFGTEVPAINKHIRNILKSGELKQEATISKMEIVQTEGTRKVRRTVELHNLDMIISVGYRVNSQRATQFRIWATNVLRDHLVRGFTLNEKRLQESRARLRELEEAVALVHSAKSEKSLSASETAGLLSVITEYTRAWLLLHQYDSGELPRMNLHRKVRYRIDEASAKKAISQLRTTLMKRQEASDLFGRERERHALKGILGSIDQTFGGTELYPTVEDKAANLLYLVVKNHPFIDGNKRIASLLFVWFLEKNKLLSHPTGERKIDDNTLVALTLLVAESNPKQKDVMTKLIINLISNR